MIGLGVRSARGSKKSLISCEEANSAFAQTASPNSFSGMPRYNACCPAVELTVTALRACRKFFCQLAALNMAQAVFDLVLFGQIF